PRILVAGRVWLFGGAPPNLVAGRHQVFHLGQAVAQPVQPSAQSLVSLGRAGRLADSDTLSLVRGLYLRSERQRGRLRRQSLSRPRPGARELSFVWLGR